MSDSIEHQCARFLQHADPIDSASTAVMQVAFYAGAAAALNTQTHLGTQSVVRSLHDFSASNHELKKS